MAELDVSTVVAIVTNKEGKTIGLEGTQARHTTESTPAGDPPQETIETIDPYRFYAATEPNTCDIEDVLPVYLVLPVGGEMSGLFRYPLVGDKVLLVKGSEDHYYLMGYIPNSAVPFNKTNADGTEDTTGIFDEKAIALRYKKSGLNPSLNKEEAPEYSEISISSKRSSFPQTLGEGKSYINDDGEVETLKAETAVNPKIDYVNISSTGDTYSSAENLNATLGQRVLLRAKYLTDTTGDVEGSIIENSDLKESEVVETDLDKGDIYLTADHRVIINAREGIIFSVGGSNISLTPSSITAVTRNMDGAEAGEGPFDAFLSLSNTSGILATGRSFAVKVKSAFSLKDGFGAKISSNLGRLSFAASSISMCAVTTITKISSFLSGVVGMLEQMVAISLSRSGQEKKIKSETIAGADISRWVDTIIEESDKYLEHLTKKADADPSPSNDYAGEILSLIMTMFEAVRVPLLNNCNKKYMVTYDKDKNKYTTEDLRYSTALSVEIVEAILISGIVITMIIHARKSLRKQASFSLSPIAATVINANEYKQASLEAEDIKTGAAGTTLAALKTAADAPNATDEQKEEYNDANEKAIKNKKFDNTCIGLDIASSVTSIIGTEVGFLEDFVDKDLTEETKAQLKEL